MPRLDLLALTDDDLATLANRGLVKRARQEIESGQLTAGLQETDDGTVTARWSDDVECVLPGGKPLAAARCSCPATTLCRHVLRTVLAYQQQGAAAASSPGPLSHAAGEGEFGVGPLSGSLPQQTGTWDPGAISDEALEGLFPKTVLARARRQFEEGQVLELVRGGAARPSARNHTLGLSLRFLVPNDPRYTHCDCGEPAPCPHVPLAVWAFRLLSSEREAGVVTTRATAYPVPATLLDEIEAALAELLAVGLASLPAALRDRLRRLEGACRAAGLGWPADILAEIGEQQTAYASGDARFDPALLPELVGELCIRMDAIRNDTGRAPQLFIRGTGGDGAPVDTGAARLVGLGCTASLHRGGGVRLSAFLQDQNSGSVLAVRRSFADPTADAAAASGPLANTAAPAAPRPLWQLAGAPAARGVSLGALGAGQLLVRGGKRSPGGEFHFGRAAVSATPQTYHWDGLLRAPLLADGFGEVRARLATLPPAALRPRRVAENLFVCPIAASEPARFDAAAQAVAAILSDPAGDAARLLHPYTDRGREGVAALLALLAQTVDPERSGTALRYVVGQMHTGGRDGLLRIAPVALVAENVATGARTMLQPWIDRPSAATGPSAATAAGADGMEAAMGVFPSADPIATFRGRLADELGDLILSGLERAAHHSARHFTELQAVGASLGFVRLLEPVATLADALESRRHTLTWTATAAPAGIVKTLCVLTMLLRDGEL